MDAPGSLPPAHPPFLVLPEHEAAAARNLGVTRQPGPDLLGRSSRPIDRPHLFRILVTGHAVRREERTREESNPAVLSLTVVESGASERASALAGSRSRPRPASLCPC